MASRALALAPAGFVLMTTLFGLNFVAVRFSNRELTPFWGAAFRFIVAAALLSAFVAARGIPWPKGRALVGTAIFGALAFGLNFSMMYWALLTSPASPAAILFSTIPLMTLAIAWSIGQEPFRVRGLVGALVALTGAVVVFADQLRADVPPLAIAAVLVAALGNALSAIVVKGFPRAHPLSANAVAMAVGAAMLLALALLAPGERLELPRLAPTWTAVAYLVGSSIVAFAVMIWLVGEWGASRVSYSGVLVPIVTAVAAAALAGESVSPTLAVGGAIVLAGVYVGALSGPKQAAAAKTARA